jgi:AraC-like DNA-binding protein
MDLTNNALIDPIIARIQRSIDFIESNLAEEININDIAQQAHFSIFHFQRIFKQYTGYSVINYLRKRRLTRVAYELCVNQSRVIDTAYDYYFEYEQSLIRAFKREFGVTPGAFRKRKVNILCTPAINKAILLRNILSMEAFRPRLNFQHRVTLVGKKEYINIQDNYTNNLTIRNQNRFLKKILDHRNGETNISLNAMIETIPGDGKGWYYMPAIEKDKAKGFFDHPDEYEIDYHFSFYSPDRIEKPVGHLNVKDFTDNYLDMYSFLNDAPYQRDQAFRYTVYDLSRMTNKTTNYSLHCPVEHKAWQPSIP